MKLNLSMMAAALVTASSASLWSAEESRAPKPEPSPVLAAAIDANNDRVLQPEEIAKAAEYLLMLDQNGDGKLSLREFLDGFSAGEKKRWRFSRATSAER